jgi:hypothetical protein
MIRIAPMPPANHEFLEARFARFLKASADSGKARRYTGRGGELQRSRFRLVLVRN